jgi:hypothetical protein
MAFNRSISLSCSSSSSLLQSLDELVDDNCGTAAGSAPTDGPEMPVYLVILDGATKAFVPATRHNTDNAAVFEC